MTSGEHLFQTTMRISKTHMGKTFMQTLTVPIV